MSLKKIEINEDNNLTFIDHINKDMALLTAKNELNNVNTMTIAWGMSGFLWYKPVIEVFVRESRYTLKFLDNSDYFSVCFFDKSYKDKVLYLGTHSGRDENKIEHVGLHILNDLEAPYFEEASEVIILKKIYKTFLDPQNFIKEEYKSAAYKNTDYHYEFIGEIVGVYKNDSSI